MSEHAWSPGLWRAITHLCRHAPWPCAKRLILEKQSNEVFHLTVCFLWCCVLFHYICGVVLLCAFSYSQAASLWTSILYIKAYISSLSVHICFILIFEVNSSLLPFISNLLSWKKDMDPKFCISFCNKPCCRGAGFLPCLVWPGTPQYGFWSLWSSQNLSYVQNFHRGLLNKGYFFLFSLYSSFNLLPPTWFYLPKLV